jgi:c-Rel proto-oncogene protein
MIVDRPHPHNLVGREGCKKGVCTLEINTDDMKMVFSNLGIQCVKKRDIEDALKVREEIRVDPFRSECLNKFVLSRFTIFIDSFCV